MSVDNNHPTDKTILEDLQIKEFHETSHKIDMVDQTVKIVKIEIIIQHQTQVEATIQIITGILQTQTPETDIIQMIALEAHHTIETKAIQTTVTDSIKKTDHETIQILDQTIIIITIDHVATLKLELRIIKIGKKKHFSLTAQK